MSANNKLVVNVSVYDSKNTALFAFVNCRPFVCALLFFFYFSVSALIASTNQTTSILDVSVLRSPSGRYVVVSTNSVWNTYLMRWIESVDVKVERMIGLKQTFDTRLIRIVVSDKQSGESEITWSQAYEQGRFVQQLNIYDYLHSDVSQSEIALSGLLLNGYVSDRQLRENFSDTGKIKDGIIYGKLEKVPSWLALGVARNLYPAYRAVNSTKLLSLYDKGELPSVIEILQQFNNPQMDDKLNEHICGIFVLWLSKIPAHANMFDELFMIFAEGKRVTAIDLSSIIDSCDSVDAMEKMWREWVLRQKRMVYELGVVSPVIVEKLKGLLVVTSEECHKVGGPITDIDFPFSELIPRRKESWVSVCARQKIISLKLTFVGRGADMNKVIDLYCQFLSALEQRKNKKKLTKLLDKADEAMVLFSEKYGSKEMVK